MCEGVRKTFLYRIRPTKRQATTMSKMCYPQYGSGANLVGDILHLSKVGPIKVVLHRPIEGTPKTVCVRKSSTGKWHAAISCEWEPAPLPPSPEQVGIDVGL